jgi:hypothetical protein
MTTAREQGDAAGAALEGRARGARCQAGTGRVRSGS